MARRIALLMVAAIVLVSGGVLAGVKYEDGQWRPIHARTLNDLHVSRTETFDAQLATSAVQDKLSTLQEKVAAKVGDLDHPHFVLWNACGSGGSAAGCELRPGRDYVGGVPDTFTYEINFKSTVPVTTRILPSHEYACRYTDACAWGSKGFYWGPTTELHVVFHEAEGCADYVAIFTATQSGTFYPEIQVTHNPASHSTGECA